MPVNVLIVDDHPVFRKGLRLLLEEEDLRVVAEAGNGEAALKLARELLPDVIVMDITMPDLDGIETTRRLMAEVPDIKVIALSIHSEKGFVEGMFAAGASGYILKESAPEEVVKGIAVVLRGEVYLSADIQENILSEQIQWMSRGSIHEDSAWGRGPLEPILATKLYRPRIPRNAVYRPRLMQRLNSGSTRGLMLVSAPAGFGKSIIVSQWLESIQDKTPGVWLSLDERDNDLRVFLTYLVAAVRVHFGEVLAEITQLLKAPVLPPMDVLARTLVNELDRFSQHFVLVLDDYHHIVQPAIHELLTKLLLHPPTTTHLVLVTRKDPPLDLLHLRAYQKMGEIRIQELSFTLEETATYLEKLVGPDVDAQIVQALYKKSEGWVTGMHLMSLVAQDSADLVRLSTILYGEQPTLDYLAVEALVRQPRQVQGYLLKTSILDRFCAPLCESVCGLSEEDEGASFGGQEFIDWLLGSDLFVIQLDQRGKWFRYHHLFQELLQKQLQNALDPAAIADLHGKASHWYSENGWSEEAIDHALEAEDTVGAAEIIERFHHDVHEAGNWFTVQRWLSTLPAEIIEQRPALILAEAWIAFVTFQLEELPQLVEQAEALLDPQTAEPILLGELSFFRGNLNYWQGEAETGVQDLEKAAALVSDKNYYIKGNIELILGLARLMSGQKEFAIQAINEKLQTADLSSSFFSAALYSGLAFINIVAGDLAQAMKPAQHMISLSALGESPTTDAWSFYLQGLIHLQSFDLQQASDFLNITIEQRYALDTEAVVDTLASLALTQQLDQQTAAAQLTSDQLLKFATDLDIPNYILIAQSCQARLATLRGDLQAGLQWALAAREIIAPSTLFLWAENPAITKARILIAHGTETHLAAAQSLLEELHRQSQAYRFGCQTIEVTVLQSLAKEKQGNHDGALKVLQEVVNQAMPGGWIRPFVEAGQPMAHLLTRLHMQETPGDTKAYIGRILAFYPTPDTASAPGRQSGLTESLTDRELEVLGLLATRLSTDEIAARLVISVNTVRMHTKNIYSKLDAHSRIEAVERARELELL